MGEEALGVGRALDELDFMELPLVVLGVHVLQRVGPLGGDVLVQRAAKGHIDELQPPAYAKDGLARLGKGFDHGQVVQVAHAIALPLVAQGHFAIAAGPDVSAAMHDHSVEPVGVMRQGNVATRRLARRARHHDNHGPGRHEPVGNGLLYILQCFPGEKGTFGVGVLETGRQTDFEAARCKHVSL